MMKLDNQENFGFKSCNFIITSILWSHDCLNSAIKSSLIIASKSKIRRTKNTLVQLAWEDHAIIIWKLIQRSGGGAKWGRTAPEKRLFVAFSHLHHRLEGVRKGQVRDIHVVRPNNDQSPDNRREGVRIVDYMTEMHTWFIRILKSNNDLSPERTRKSQHLHQK